MNRWVAGNVVWPLNERLLQRDTLSRARSLGVTQNRSRSELRTLQNRKLRERLRLADRHCPFYHERFREAGIDPDRADLTVDDLRAIQPLTRSEIHAHLDRMVWWNCPRGGPKPYNTGGSTGEPLRFFFDRFRQSADWASRLRGRTWWGIQPGDPELMLWGVPPQRNWRVRLQELRDGLLNQRILSAFDMTRTTMDHYLDVIRSFRPVCIYGYPSSLALLARHAMDRGMRADCFEPSRLKAVFVTGEVLVPSDREVIEQVFGAPVVPEYGSRDGGLIACGCPAGHLHVNEENVIVELLDEDNRPVQPGEIGQVTLTHLETFAMPLIRYQVGDLARFATADDSVAGPSNDCGIALQVLAEVKGRSTDQIYCESDGETRSMHALSLIYVLREAPGVVQFRIIQPSLSELIVELVAGEALTPSVETGIRHRLQRQLGTGVAIEIRRCDRIPPTRAGKHAYVVSHVRQEWVAA